MNKVVFIVGALFVIAVAGCDQPQSQATNEQVQAEQTPGGHSETKTLKAAGLVGYDGKRLQKSVDKVLDAADQRNKQLEDGLNKADDQ